MPVHDYDTSEGESGADTLSTQRVYTPTSSTDMNTSSTVSADEGLEHTPLLSDHDEYDSSYVGEKTPPSIDSEAGEVGGLKEAKEPLLPTPDARAAPHDRCRRRRCRRVCLLVSVKVILLVGSLGWLTWFFGIVSWVSCLYLYVYPTEIYTTLTIPHTSPSLNTSATATIQDMTSTLTQLPTESSPSTMARTPSTARSRCTTSSPCPPPRAI